MTVTLTYDAALSRVRIAATALAEAGAARFERSTNQITWSTIRGGDHVPLLAGAASVDDYEFAPDVINYYRVTRLDYAAGFEVNTAGWEPEGGTSTFVRSTARAKTGTASGLQTPDGTAVTVRAKTTIAGSPPVVPGTAYTVTAWLNHDTGRDVDVSVMWLDAADLQVGTFDIWAAITAAADTWTKITGTRTAPSGAAKAKVHINQRTTPPASALLWIDDVTFTPVVFTPEPVVSITPSLGGQIWLKNITRPFLNRVITVTEFSETSRPGRGAVFPIVGRSYPVAVTDLHSSRQQTIEVMTTTLAAADELDLITAAGDPVLLHVPAGCPVRGMYAVIGDTSQSRRTRSAKSARRYTSVPLTEIARPDSLAAGATVTWQGVINAYATWQALVAAKASWQAVVDTVGAPTDVIVP